MKKLAVVLAALMMFSTTTFLAAPSIDTTVGSATEGVGIAQDMMDTIPESYVTEYSNAALEKTNAEGAEVAAITFLTGTVPTDGKVTLTGINGLKVGDTIKVFHLYDEAATGMNVTGTWVERTAKVVGEGTIEIDFTGAAHFSPIVIVKVPVAKEEAPAQDLSGLASLLHHYSSTAAAPSAPAVEVAPEATLPKTGAVVVLPFAAMACLAGAVVCGRKEK